MQFLHKDIVLELGLNLDIRDVINLSVSCKRLNDILCNNQNFWKCRYYREFGDVLYAPNYKKLYFVIRQGTDRNIEFMRTICNKYMNTLLTTKFVMELYSNVQSYFMKKKNPIYTQPMINYLISEVKGIDEELRKDIYNIFSYMFRRYKTNRINKDMFLELTC